ncbi:MAG: CBS domain-containing protein [Cyclobacteriaceae bacterium]|nr:CBS domain-containing protein [Cyclobacteriaceae bacterium]UYN86767.1 MAG: CBS domain-containing protein [Cyclobacteriaceae bacterium]
MKKREPVNTIMTKNVVAVQLDDTLLNANKLILKHHIRHLPVVHGTQLVGMLSKTDLNRLTFSGLFAGEGDADEAVFDMLNISQVMSHKPRAVKETDTIKEVAEILSKEEFHSLPVVADEDESKLVGIVTTTDVIKYMLQHY